MLLMKCDLKNIRFYKIHKYLMQSNAIWATYLQLDNQKLVGNDSHKVIIQDVLIKLHFCNIILIIKQNICQNNITIAYNDNINKLNICIHFLAKFLFLFLRFKNDRYFNAIYFSNKMIFLFIDLCFKVINIFIRFN